PALICEATDDVQFSATPDIEGATYTWTFPSGATIDAPGNTSTITVDFADNASDGQVSVTVTSSAGCASAASGTANITVNDRPDNPTVVAPALICEATDDVQFSATPDIAGAT